MGHGRLPQAQNISKLAYGGTLLDGTQDDAQDLKPCRISHRSQRARQLLGGTSVEGTSDLELGFRD